MSLESLIARDLQSIESQASSRRYFGVWVGKVTDNKDTTGQFRVKVHIPGLHKKDEQASWWARVATVMAGNEVGFFNIPSPGEEVLVAFGRGDDEEPFVIGALWGGVNKPISSITTQSTDVTSSVSINDQGGKNDFIGLVSRAKGQVVVNDGDGYISIRTASKAEICLTDAGKKVQIHDQNRTQWVEIDVDGKKITIQTDPGEILIKAKTKITMECEDFILNASKSIDINCDGSSTWDDEKTFKHKTGKTYDVEAGGDLTMKGGPNINLNP